MKHLFYILMLSQCCLLISSCNYTEKIQTGESAFEQRQYNESISFLQDDFNGSSDRTYRAEKSYYLGKAFAKLNRYEEAVKWYTTSKDLGFGERAQLDLAATYQNLEEYDKAIMEYRKIESQYGGSTEARSEMINCQFAKQQLKDADKYNYEIKKAAFNSAYSDYGAVLYNGFIVFTSDRPDSEGEEKYKWTGADFSDMFMVSKHGNSVQPFNDLLNSLDHEGTPCFSQNTKEVFFTRCTGQDGDINCKIFWSKKEGNDWTDPIEPILMKDNVNYGHPTLIEKDSVLVFSSNDPSGFGGRDLYYSVLDEEGWSPPELMPRSLNTEGDEMFPVADADTIYYSSNHLPGMGGLDIFKTYLQENRQWSIPLNMGYPINSGADDFSLLVDRKSKFSKNLEGYLSSSRENNGYDNIYSFKQIEIEKPKVEEPVVITETEEPKFRLFVVGKVYENIYRIKNNPNSGIKEKTVLRGAQVSVSKNGKSDTQFTTGPDGRFITELNVDNQYDFLAQKKGFLNNKIDFKFPFDELKSDTTINVEIVLDRLFRGKEIVLDDIYYDYNKANIREDAKPSLSALTTILNNNPKLRIQLASHTDCRGEDDYNLTLSQQRAQSAVDFLIDEGINPSRLVARGYGKKRVLTTCNCDDCSEEEHQINRRTTFKILY